MLFSKLPCALWRIGMLLVLGALWRADTRVNPEIPEALKP
jgi:hypothetical protein